MNTFKNQVQFLLFFMLIAFQSTAVFGQTCSVPSLGTQAAIDNFATDYPGCTCIEFPQFGSSIAGADITNLNGLSQVTKIVGGLRITQTNLTSMSGLENLDTITQLLWFDNNSLLNDLTDLSNLNSVPRLTVMMCLLFTQVSLLRK